MPQGDSRQLLMLPDSFLATGANDAVAFASDRNRKCHLICPCVRKSVWQLTGRPASEGGQGLLKMAFGYSGGTAGMGATHMQHSNVVHRLLMVSRLGSPRSLD